MKKLFILFIGLGLGGCYYSVPAQDVYFDGTYTTSQTQTYYAPSYGTTMYVDAQSYVTVPSTSIMYVEQSAPEVVYVQTEPEIVYVENPLLPHQPPHPHYVPIHHHRVGTVPKKHIARPISHGPAIEHKPHMEAIKPPVASGHRKSPEGRP